jgi:hypothetical protein
MNSLSLLKLFVMQDLYPWYCFKPLQCDQTFPKSSNKQHYALSVILYISVRGLEIVIAPPHDLEAICVPLEI